MECCAYFSSRIVCLFILKSISFLISTWVKCYKWNLWRFFIHSFCFCFVPRLKRMFLVEFTFTIGFGLFLIYNQSRFCSANDSKLIYPSNHWIMWPYCRCCRTCVAHVGYQNTNVYRSYNAISKIITGNPYIHHRNIYVKSSSYPRQPFWHF